MPSLVEDAEGELLLAAAAQLGGLHVELQPRVGDGEAVDGLLRAVAPGLLGGVAVRVAAGHRRGLLLAPGVRVEGAARDGGRREEHGERRAEEGEPDRRAHRTTS